MQKLLILHGWSSNSGRWQKIKELLEKQGIEVLIPDLPGFGSEPPPKEIWGVEEYKNWVMKFLEEKKWERFNLLGHSFGGGVASLIAAENPDRVEKLILTGCAAIRKESGKVKALKKLSKIGKSLLNKTGVKDLKPFQKVFARISGSYDYYNARGIMKEIFKKVISENLEPILEEIKKPTLILWGENDKMVSIENAYKIKKEISSSKLVIFKNVGHSLHLEIPEIMTAEIINFLKNKKLA